MCVLLKSGCTKYRMFCSVKVVKFGNTIWVCLFLLSFTVGHFYFDLHACLRASAFNKLYNYMCPLLIVVLSACHYFMTAISYLGTHSAVSLRHLWMLSLLGDIYIYI